MHEDYQKTGDNRMNTKTDRSTVFFDVIKNRRSIRKFKSTPIPKEHITRILEAASLAPTANNRQPWKFLVIQNPETIDAIKRASVELKIQEYTHNTEHTPEQLAARKEKVSNHYDDIFSAPAYIVVFTDSYEEFSHYNTHDGPLAAAHICLSAQALGYGSLYATESISDAAIRKIITVPVKYTFVCGIPIGIPESIPEMPPKKPVDELVVYEHF
ncbi:MAG: nitroreductase family protein [candidate division WOR-3 bacterium]|nr:MAG: nitroreductase family protein [candidate division WOR-3 bacterium]